MHQKCLLLFLFISLNLLADEFPYEPPKNFTLSYQYIALHHPVTTTNPAAQLYFDQGLTLLYAFNHDAAFWSFLKASEADPDLAMAYWGMALVLGKNINIGNDPEREKKAYQLAQKAREHAKGASENEQAYVDAISVRYSDSPAPDYDQQGVAYSQAMRRLHVKYPDDPDAAVLFAESLMTIDPWHQWTQMGSPLKDTPEALTVLESVLKSYPMHLGANHYYIHAVEASAHPEWALICAERLKKMLPASGHILHMPSHIYFRVGDYRAAAQANENAVAVDRGYIREYGALGIYPVHYLSHNLFFLTRTYTVEGNYGRARQSAQELENLYLPHRHRMPELEEYASPVMLVELRFNRWKEILDRAEPDPKMRMTHLLWLYARAQAYLGLGDKNRAAEEQKRFEEELTQLPKNYNFGLNPAIKIASIADNLLKARFLEADGHAGEASEKLLKAVQDQDDLRYNEPPDWYFPVRETLGGLFLRSSKYQEAERVFRKDLEHYPCNGRSLFGLREALKSQKQMDDFYWVDLQYQKAWLYSDTDLTISQL
ncbi:MAG: hypothetical protein LLG04_01020 [Parachlamydia sp.]|nr:hypothetical protein [Parachlamydia sp.]